MTADVRSVQRRVGLIPTLAALLVVVVTLLLGRWQVHRAQEKTLLQAALEQRRLAPAVTLADQPMLASAADTLRFRAAQASGTYLPSGQIYIDNRDHDGVPGYHVLTPLQLGHRVVLVNRGFLARSSTYPRAPEVPVPDGPQAVTGHLAPAQTRYMELSSNVVSGPVWQNLQLTRYAEVHHLEVLPLVLLAEPASPGLLAVVATPDAGIDMHRGYAFQWFSLAATTVALYLYFNFFRKAGRPS